MKRSVLLLAIIVLVSTVARAEPSPECLECASVCDEFVTACNEDEACADVLACFHYGDPPSCMDQGTAAEQCYCGGVFQVYCQVGSGPVGECADVIKEAAGCNAVAPLLRNGCGYTSLSTPGNASYQAHEAALCVQSNCYEVCQTWD